MISKREGNRIRVRKAILEAATTLFAARGFEAVTMTEVAAKAGVVRATVFNHFSNKHRLIEAITADVFAYYRAIFDRALEERAAHVPSLVLTLLVHMGEGIESAERFYGGLFREILRVLAGLDEGAASGTQRAAALTRVALLMERGQERGELRLDLTAHELARAFDSIATGTIVEWLYERESAALGDRMRSAASLFLGGAVHGREVDASWIDGLVPLSATPTGPPEGPGGER